jgi:hypothetical protein
MLGSFVVIGRYFILGIIMYGVLCSGGCGIDYDINGGGFRTRVLCFFIYHVADSWCFVSH